MNVGDMQADVAISAMTQEILTPIATRDGSVVWITLNRPEKANALSSDLLMALLDALDAAENHPEVRAVIIKGEGKHFCAGANLQEFLDGGTKAVRSLLNLFRTVTLRFETSPLAIIGAVHGAARAGGLEFLLTFDAVVAADSATLGDAHLLRNLLPAGGSSVRLPRTIGHQRAKWMILSGESIDAATAREWGIVQTVVAEPLLFQAARELADRLTLADKSTFLAAKTLLFNSDVLPYRDALENEIAVLEKHADSDGFWDGLSRFMRR